jgi:hypothetical protein
MNGAAGGLFDKASAGAAPASEPASEPCDCASEQEARRILPASRLTTERRDAEGPRHLNRIAARSAKEAVDEHA